MGMDVIGVKPTSETGEYFRRNVWRWHPLAEYIMQVAPDTAAACEHWHTNDGAGLNRKASVELARILREEITSGRALKLVHRRNSILSNLPDEECWVCAGTGKRTEPPNVGAGELPCNGCEATGKVRPDETFFHLDLSDIEEFASFLENCGGFVIH
jgi:hypothetical protein